MKLIEITNIVLIVIALILIVNLIQPISTITGNVLYKIDTSEPRCLFNNMGDLREIPIDKCCYEIQKQLRCKSTNELLDLKCYTSETSERYYLINYKTFSYCKKEGYHVKLK